MLKKESNLVFLLTIVSLVIGLSYNIYITIRNEEDIEFFENRLDDAGITGTVMLESA